MDTNAQLKAAYSWLRERAEELIQASSYVRPQDGRLMEFVSVMGQGRYQGMWTRDYAYRVIALPERYASDTGAGSLSLLLEQFSADFVPPELVRADGRVDYWTLGPGPATDNAPILALAVLAHCQACGTFDLLDTHLDQVYHSLTTIPTHPISGLIWIDPEMPHSAYGYTDMIERTGEEFITSVWLWQAYRELADAIEPRNPEWAADCRQRAEQIQRGLEGLYDAESGLYFATSGVGRQPDVWGSALAVSNGAAGERALGIAEALAGMYDRIV